jgi:hypothetical protein
MKCDYSNPFHRASLIIEDLKYGEGAKRVEVVPEPNMKAQLTALLITAKITTVTAEQILDAIGFYGESNARALRVPEVIARSIFIDGVMHGLAVAGGLGRSPRPDELEI